MRLIALFVLMAAPVWATPGNPTEPSVTRYNGFSLAIEFASENGPNVPESVDKKAQRVCGSIGKSAEIQSIRRVSNYRAEFFFICL